MTTLAKLELAILNPFQEELHLPQGSKNEIDSNFYQENEPVAWYSRQRLVFEQTTVTDSKVRYTTPEGATFCLKSVMHQTLPAINVKQAYADTVQICWTPYPAIACILSAELKIDACEPMSFPSQWYDIQMQYFRKPNYTAQRLTRAGHVPELVHWQKTLPEHACSLPQPFMYSRSSVDALPLNLNHANKAANVIQHIYTLRNKVSALLRMRRLKAEGGWEEIAVDTSYLDPCPMVLETPQLWGVFTFNTSEEIDNYRCDKNGPGIVRYYEDVIHLTSTNSEELGKRMTRALTECALPCRDIFWMCENTTATENRCYSNYTTSADFPTADINTHPIASSSLNYGSKKRFDQLTNDHFDDECEDIFPSPALDQGYCGLSFPTDMNHRIDVGVILKELNANLNVNLRHDATCKDKFLLHVILLVSRKLTYRKDESGRFLAELND